AVTMGKPHIELDVAAGDTFARARAFLCQGQDALALCVAGPRESEAPGIYAKAYRFLRELFGEASGQRD
ncbi:MAG: YpsA SLOG family protein, partial [Bradyrhizobium sp.]